MTVLGRFTCLAQDAGICKHWHADMETTHDSIHATCDAFPDGIPVEILSGKADHTKPYEDDHGIQYEPKDASAG